MKRWKKGFLGNESGAVAVYAAFGLVALLGCAALALDIAHQVAVKRELAKAAEAGALSGARGLWPVTLPTLSGSRDPDSSAGQTWALSAATKNKVDGTNLATAEVTVEVGRWNYTTKQFTPGANSSANGVRVTTRRNDVQMILAKILGQMSRNMSATAIAVMDFAAAVGQGTLPIAVNKMYTDPGTTLFINFTPDPLDNGGWFADPPDKASAKTFKDYINDATCPPLNIGDIINLQNGLDSSVLSALEAKLLSQPEEADGTRHLDTMLPVVDTDKFNQFEAIQDFVPFRITSVAVDTPKGINGTVIGLTEMQSALPGGGKVGGLAPPKLVQ
jgi:Flp pilus assembly protein TadG